MLIWIHHFLFKAFVDKFSRDLSAEVKHSGVTVQTVHPGFVVTNMSKLRRSTWTAPTPDTFAKAALSNLGLDDRTAGFWFHKIQVQNRIIKCWHFPATAEFWFDYSVCFHSFTGVKWYDSWFRVSWQLIRLNSWSRIAKKFSTERINQSKRVMTQFSAEDNQVSRS